MPWGQKRIRTLAAFLLHVGDFAVDESHLHILVDVKLLGAEIHDLVGLAQCSLHLISGLSFFDGLRFGLGLLLLRLGLRLRLTAALLLRLLLASLLLPALRLLLTVVADGKQLPDRVFDLSRAGLSQRSLGGLKNHLGFQ